MAKYCQWELDVIGVLPSDEYMSYRYDKTTVFINKQNSAQFSILPISETPSTFPNAVVTGYPSDIETFNFEDEIEESDAHREEEVKQFFNDNLLIFNPLKKGEHFALSKVRLVPKPQGYSENTTYIPMPVFSQETHGYSFGEFLKKLKQNKFVGKIMGISTDPSETPSLILWKDSQGDFKVIGEFEKHRYAHGGFSFTYKNLKYIDFEENWYVDAIIDEKSSKNLIFVGNDTFKEMLIRIDAAKEYELPLPETSAVLAAEATSTAIIEQEAKPEGESEGALLETFTNVARECGFAYDPKDLINFHTAMKSSNLVILAGMSGTGKSQLVQLYGRALGMDEEQLTIIPVRPAWTDDADLIGYVDAIHMVYRPGDCGLVNTLIKASQEQERLFIVCFDEMNLARVEHYFSQFLSVLEMEGHRRRLKLYNDEVQQRLYNGSEYPPTIPIGDNVMFIGTVNLDESTYHFSDKVLDRSNVISLNILDFAELKGLNTDKRRASKNLPEIPYAQYASYKKEEFSLELNDREIKFFTELHKTFREVNKNLGFGPRVVRQIAKYISNLPEGGSLTREQAIDLQVVQRILTKLRGPEDQLKPLLGSFNTKTAQLDEGILFKVLEKFSDVSQFEQTDEIITLKAKELKMYGYTV